MAESIGIKYNPQTLLKPSTIEDTISALKKHGIGARIVAGNTTIYELARQAAFADVHTLIDIMPLGLNYVKGDGDTIHLGATLSFSEMAIASVLDQNPYFALKETAGKITPPQIRNMGTLGGSMCSGIPFYDMPTTMLALDAKIKAVSMDGERIISADDFFLDYFTTALSPEELLVEAQIKRSSNGGSSFIKLGRTSIDFAMVNCAVSVTLNKSSHSFSEVRVALGAVSNIPMRAKVTEQTLIGHEPSEEIISRASREAANFEPTPSVHASSKYKKKVIPVVVREALLSAVDRALKAAPRSTG